MHSTRLAAMSILWESPGDTSGTAIFRTGWLVQNESGAEPLGQANRHALRHRPRISRQGVALLWLLPPHWKARPSWIGWKPHHLGEYRPVRHNPVGRGRQVHRAPSV